MASLVNAEYGVIQNRWELIARVSESFLSVLVDKLSSNDLVTFVEHDNTTETARDVVMNILKKVKEDNSVFYKFMSILKDCNQENMVRLLESDLKKDKNKESECNLRIENIPEICEAMYGARLKWYEIGMFLQFGIGTLDAIKTDEKETNKCFLRMLIRWLQIGKNTTWNALADALRSKSVDCPDIADRLLEEMPRSLSTQESLDEVPFEDSKTPISCVSDLPIWNVQIRSLKYLNLIRYHDPNTNKKKELRILDDLSADWEFIGEILDFRPPEIDAIRHPGAGKTPIHCLQGVISKWLQNADSIPSSKQYPCSWNGLYNMLKDSKHGATANDLKAAITASSSDLHQSFDDGCSQLIMDNFEEVSINIIDVKLKWYEIGMMLHLNVEILDAIKNIGCDRCFEYMLRIWLENGENNNWNALLDALRSKIVGRHDIADHLVEKISTSSQFSEKSLEKFLLENTGTPNPLTDVRVSADSGKIDESTKKSSDHGTANKHCSVTDVMVSADSGKINESTKRSSDDDDDDGTVPPANKHCSVTDVMVSADSGKINESTKRSSDDDDDDGTVPPANKHCSAVKLAGTQRVETDSLLVHSGNHYRIDATMVGMISALLVGLISFPTGLVLIIIGSIQRFDGFISAGTSFILSGVASVIVIIIVVILWKLKKRS